MCGECGRITGVEGSPSDLSRYVPRGKTRLWGIDEKERVLLGTATSSLPKLRAMVARARPHADIPGLLLVDATGNELDEMYSFVEALADTRGGRRRLEDLDELRRTLCTAIDRW